MFTDLEESLLSRLIRAEDTGRPLTFADLGVETRGSTFEDLFGSRRVVVKGKEDVIMVGVTPQSQLVASPYGRWWVEAQKAKRDGRPEPPKPKPTHTTVRLIG